MYSCAKGRSGLSILISLSKGRRVICMESKCTSDGGHEEGVLVNLGRRFVYGLNYCNSSTMLDNVYPKTIT